MRCGYSAVQEARRKVWRRQMFEMAKFKMLPGRTLVRGGNIGPTVTAEGGIIKVFYQAQCTPMSSNGIIKARPRQTSTG